MRHPQYTHLAQCKSHTGNSLHKVGRHSCDTRIRDGNRRTHRGMADIRYPSIDRLNSRAGTHLQDMSRIDLSRTMMVCLLQTR